MFGNEKRVKAAFKVIKEELSEHLDAINENTEELQSVYNYTQELEHRIDKIEDRLIKLEMMIEERLSPKLNKQEEAVFMQLYENEAGALSYSDISHKLGIPELIVRKIIANMIKKGVEVNVDLIDGKPFFSLVKSFKEKQAKENILKLQNINKFWGDSMTMEKHCNYDKIKLLYQLSAMSHFLYKHAIPDAKNEGHPLCAAEYEELRKDIIKHIHKLKAAIVGLSKEGKFDWAFLIF